MPGRNAQGDYRYAYQGQEKDPETGWEAFELRMYDGRVGRWMTTDPYSQYHSPYLAMGNNPVKMIDPDGGKALDEFELQENGRLKLIKETSDDFDIIWNKERTEKIKIDDVSILAGATTFDKEITYRGEKMEVAISITHHIKDTDLAKELFFFLADNSDVEYGFTTYDTKAGDWSYITTSHLPKMVYAESFYQEIFLNKFKTWKIKESWHNHPRLALDYSDRQPSGFRPDGTPIYNMGPTDRRFYENKSNRYGDRIPEYYKVYDALNKKYYWYDNHEFIIVSGGF